MRYLWLALLLATHGSLIELAKNCLRLRCEKMACVAIILLRGRVEFFFVAFILGGVAFPTLCDVVVEFFFVTFARGGVVFPTLCDVAVEFLRIPQVHRISLEMQHHPEQM